MVIFALILAAIGLMILPLGQLYIIKQRKRNSRFSNPIFVHKLEIILRVICICLFGTALYIIHSMI